MARPLVALVGRPNVGKSTLFNRLVGAPVAVVHGAPGTTRDRLYGSVEWNGRAFLLVDTGGIELEAGGELEQAVAAQVALAISEAEVIVFLTDVRDGITAADLEIAQRLRRTDKPVLLAVNKADSARDRARADEFYELGLDQPLAVSALRGLGTGDLLDAIVAQLPQEAGPAADLEPERVPVAIVGRPNVGKSSLVNAIVGQPRAVVSAQPGTTRDALDTDLDYQGRPLRLIDTAGIRRRGRIGPGVETSSVLRALRAIDRAEVAVLLVDAVEGVTAQDAHVAGFVHESAKGCVIAVNKWDLLPPRPQLGEEQLAQVRQGLHFLDYAPVVFLSARTGLHVPRLIEEVFAVAAQRDRRIPTAEVNAFIQRAVAAHPQTTRGKALKVLYATQAAVRPPTFVFFVNDPDLVHFAYRRYLENQLRRQFGFAGTGLRLIFRRRGE